MSHLNGSLLPRRGDPLSVRAELELVDAPAVALVREDATLATDVPELEVCIGRTAGQEVAWRKKI